MELNIRDLSVSITNNAIIEKLSMEVREGEFVSLLGPSGCGKSTLLKTIAGILPAKEGSILLGGSDITNLPPHKRKAVIVFQDMRLFPNMSVWENVAFPLKMQGVSKAEGKLEASKYLSMVQLEGFEMRRVSQMSGGQQQRVALARALCAKPSLLLLDEPFSALDENLRDEMRSLVRSLHDKTHMTTILVTHDRHEALALSDRLALMLHGEILQYASPEELYSKPASPAVADYFGDNVYIEGSVKNGLFSSHCLTCPAAVSEGEYSLMLRPASFILSESGSVTMELVSSSFRGSDNLTVWKLGDKLIKKSFAALPCKIGEKLNWQLDEKQLIFFKKDVR